MSLKSLDFYIVYIHYKVGILKFLKLKLGTIFKVKNYPQRRHLAHQSKITPNIYNIQNTNVQY